MTEEKNIGKNLYKNYTYKHDWSSQWRGLQQKGFIGRDDKFHTTEYYLAYGSNLNLGQLAHRCPDAKHVGNVTVDDWQLVFRGVADIEPAVGKKLVAGIFKISKQDEIALDRYEGYPNLYYKDFMDMQLDGQPIKVMYYRMHKSGIARPSDYYYKTILQGFMDCGLDISVLAEAYNHTLANITTDPSGHHFPKRKGKSPVKKENASTGIIQRFRDQLNKKHKAHKGG